MRINELRRDLNEIIVNYARLEEADYYNTEEYGEALEEFKKEVYERTGRSLTIEHDYSRVKITYNRFGYRYDIEVETFDYGKLESTVIWKYGEGLEKCIVKIDGKEVKTFDNRIGTAIYECTRSCLFGDIDTIVRDVVKVYE